MTMQGPSAPRGRHVGVMNTRSERTGDAPQYGEKNSLINCAEIKTYAIQYTEADGKISEVTVVMMLGDQVYLAPNSVQWAKSLSQLKADHPIVKALKQRLSSEAPAEGRVDVLAMEEESK